MPLLSTLIYVANSSLLSAAHLSAFSSQLHSARAYGLSCLGGMQQKCSSDPLERLKTLTVCSWGLETVPDAKNIDSLELGFRNCTRCEGKRITAKCRTLPAIDKKIQNSNRKSHKAQEKQRFIQFMVSSQSFSKTQALVLLMSGQLPICFLCVSHSQLHFSQSLSHPPPYLQKYTSK